MGGVPRGWRSSPFRLRVSGVFCAFAASSHLSALAQLVERILRQPNSMKTGVGALDEFHVITHYANTAAVVKAIKNGLELGGSGT